MSWNLSASGVGVNELSLRAQNERDRILSTASEPGFETQMNEAILATVKMIESGGWGDPDSTHFSLLLSGHANPDHKPREGWANDAIYISLTQRTP